MKIIDALMHRIMQCRFLTLRLGLRVRNDKEGIFPVLSCVARAPYVISPPRRSYY